MIATWLLLYILGAILGGALLSWLLLGGRHESQVKKYKQAALQDKQTIQSLAKDIEKFKTEAKRTLELKEKEIKGLKSATPPVSSLKWKSLAKDLEKELATVKTKPDPPNGQHKQLMSIQSELSRKNKMLEESEQHIVKLEEKLSEKSDGSAKNKKLKKKLKVYKKKLKALQGQMSKSAAIETIEITETIDLAKFKKLLKKGKLTKKTKKISKKKLSSKEDS